MNKWISRKLLVALLTPVVAGFAKYFGLDDTTVTAIVGALTAYILGQSYVDSKSGASPA